MATRHRDRDLLGQGVEALGKLPRVDGARLLAHDLNEGDATVALTINGRGVRLLALAAPELKGREGTLVHRAKELEGRTGKQTLLVTRYCPRPTGNRLAEQGVNFVDLAGNAHLHLQHYWLLLLGQPLHERARVTRGKAFVTPAGLRVAYAFLARPNQVWRVRELAQETKVAVGHVVHILRDLREVGTIRRAGPRAGHITADRGTLLDRWLLEYGAVLRPRLLAGEFAPLRGTLEEAVAGWKDADWKDRLDVRQIALAGTWGADLLVGFYRGPRLVLFAEPPARQWVRPLKIVPQDGGPIAVLEPVAPLQREDNVLKEDLWIAPPLLVYAELLFEGDARAREQAALLARKYPEVQHGR